MSDIAPSSSGASHATWETLHELQTQGPGVPGHSPDSLAPQSAWRGRAQHLWTTGPLGRIRVLLHIPSLLLPSALPEHGEKQEKFTQIKTQERRPNGLGGKTQKRC